MGIVKKSLRILNSKPNVHFSTDSAFSNTSYMASTLRDGCDIDSMDRSLLDCELLLASSSHPLDSSPLPFLSLDPGKLVGQAGSEAEGSSIRSSSRNLPDGGSSCGPACKAEEAVPEVCTDSADSRSESGTLRRETVVRFEAAEPIISTLLVAAGTKMEEKIGGASSKGEH